MVIDVVGERPVMVIAGIVCQRALTDHARQDVANHQRGGLMPRAVTVTLPPSQTDNLLTDVQALDGIISIA